MTTQRFVCPPWFLCHCNGRPVGRTTMLRHHRQANAERRKLGRGLFKWGPKVTDRRMTHYSFETVERFSEHGSEEQDPNPLAAEVVELNLTVHRESSGTGSKGTAERHGIKSAYETDRAQQNIDSAIDGSVHVDKCEQMKSDVVNANSAAYELVSQEKVAVTSTERCEDSSRNDSDVHNDEPYLVDCADSNVALEQRMILSAEEVMQYSPQVVMQNETNWPVVSDGVDSQAADDHGGNENFSNDETLHSRIPGLHLWIQDNKAWVDMFNQHGLGYAVMENILRVIKAPCKSWKTVFANIMGSSGLDRELETYPTCPGHFCFAKNNGNQATEHPLHCSICGKQTGLIGKESAVVRYLPLSPRIRNIVACKTSCQHLYAYRDSRNAESEVMKDYFDGEAYRKLCATFGGESELTYDIFLAASTDGFQAFKNNTFDVWPLLCILLNLPPSERYSVHNIMPMMFTTDGSNPTDLESYIIPLVQEVKKSHENGGFMMKFYDGENRRVRFHLVWVSTDLAALGKVSGITGHNGRCPCRFCDIHGIYFVRMGGVSVKR